MGRYAEVPKRSWAKKPIDVSFDLPDGVTISSCSLSANELIPPDHAGSDVTATFLTSNTATITGDTVTAVTQAGTHLKRYEVVFRAIFSDGSRKERVVLVLVDDERDD